MGSKVPAAETPGKARAQGWPNSMCVSIDEDGCERLSSPNVPPFPELKASLEQTHLFCKRLWDFPLVKGYENCALCPFWVPEIQLSSLQLIRDPHLWVLLWSVSQNLVSGPQHGILARL